MWLIRAAQEISNRPDERNFLWEVTHGQTLSIEIEFRRGIAYAGNRIVAQLVWT
jgi:hypothetical protein